MAEPSHGFRKFMLDPKTSVMTYIADNIPTDRIQGGNPPTHTQSQQSHSQQTNVSEPQMFQAQNQPSQGQSFLGTSNNPSNVGQPQPFQSQEVQANALTSHSQTTSNQPFFPQEDHQNHVLPYVGTPGQSVQSSIPPSTFSQPPYIAGNVQGNFQQNPQEQTSQYGTLQTNGTGSLPYPHPNPQQYSSQWDQTPESQDGLAHIQGMQQLAIPSPSEFRVTSAEMLGQGPPPLGARRKSSAQSASRTYHRMILDYEGTNISFFSARSQNRFHEMSSSAYELESLSRRIWGLRRDHTEEFEDFSITGHASVIATWRARYELWADTVLDLQEGHLEPTKLQSWTQGDGSSNDIAAKWNSQSNSMPYRNGGTPNNFMPSEPGNGTQQQYDSGFPNYQSGQNGPQLNALQNLTHGQEISGQRIQQVGAQSQIDQSGKADFPVVYSRNEPVAPNNPSRNPDISQGRQSPHPGAMVSQNKPSGMGPQSPPRQNVPLNQISQPGPNPNIQSRPNPSRPGTPSGQPGQPVLPRQNILPTQNAPAYNNAPTRTQQDSRSGNSTPFRSNIQAGGQGQSIRQ